MSNLQDMNALANKHGTDKGPIYHNYTQWYARYFSELRNKPVTILELGWGGHEDPDKGGASAQLWRDWFKNATVICIDIEEKVITKAHDGIHFRQGSQADPQFIQSLADEFGPFDIIIDDASHLSSLTIKSWELLYPHLKADGIYVVEDTHFSYHAHYYGKDEANENPKKPRSNGQPTGMQYFKSMADEVNYKGRYDLDLFPKRYWQGYDIEWIHFYFNILFLQKRQGVV